MSVTEVLYTIFIGPLQLIFEIIFAVANRVMGHPGLAIMALSLIMNFLVLPLYRSADRMQEEARDVELKLQRGVQHIKKCFNGDERMMILQTYYQQNHYKPTDALNGAISLLLEIPFFIAAYQFLSHLEVLQGIAFGPIANLGAPDGLLIIGGITINILPVIMTFVNIISSALYLKGFPVKTKIQLYAMAIFFLIFLYTSPSGLVFYWTLNNVFSLIKNIFYKLKNPKRVISLLAFIAGIGVLFCIPMVGNELTLKGTVVLIVVSLSFQIPLVSEWLKNKKNISLRSWGSERYQRNVFLFGNLFLTIFIGVLIPSTVIAASPIEFVDISYYQNSLWYLGYAFCLAVGVFLVWMQVFYWLASDKGKAIFDRVIWIICGLSVINYMFFGTNMGILTPNLQYERGVDWGFREEITNFFVLILVAGVLYIIMQKASRVIAMLLLTIVIATAYMSIVNIRTINNANKELEVLLTQGAEEEASFSLSKNGNNVIVFMLDRAMGQFVPYIMDEKPELKEQFAGFTYYSNTLSYGGFTNFATPALYGGYEYTPTEINKRDEVTLETKHNEALKVMPKMFCDYDYEVTVCDPPYAGYTWIPDLTVFDDIPQVDTYITQGKYNDIDAVIGKIENRKRNFFCYSIMKTMPLLVQEVIYDNGRYNQAEMRYDNVYGTQIQKSISIAEGLSSTFMDQYNVLVELPEITNVTEEDKNTFAMLSNCTTHEPMLLQEPGYVPSYYVDNTDYNTNNQERFCVDGRKMIMENSYQMSHYQTNMAVLLQLGKWFDYMRENEVYDNTRIILVADHGRGLAQFDEVILGNENNEMFDLEYYYPLLMVKDFNSYEFRISEEFMTNADVPVLATESLIENPINPYTGNAIDNTAKESTEHYIFAGSQCVTTINNGNVFLPELWLRFNGKDVWDSNNWEIINEKTTMPLQE